MITSQQNWLRYVVEHLALRSINLLLLSWIKLNWLKCWRIRKLYLSLRRVIKQTVVTTEAYQFANYVQNFIQHPAVDINSICTENYWRYRYGFRRNKSITDHIFCIRQILEKKWEYNEAVHQLFIDFKKACDSVGMEVLCNTLIESAIPMKLASRVGYARTKVIGSRTSFVIVSVRSSIRWNICI